MKPLGRMGAMGVACLALAGWLAALPAVCLAQDKGEEQYFAFWENDQRKQAAAGAQVILAQDPFLTLALRFNGQRFAVWTEAEFVADRVLPLDAGWLAKIIDNTFPPDFSKRDLITDIKTSEWAYRTIYRDALIKAFHTPDDVFTNAASEFASVKWEQLMTNPGFYRGKVVGIEGKLRKLVAMEAPGDIRPPIENVYEAWIQTPTNPRPIVCVFSHLPDEFKVYENTILEKPQPVSFVGYFIMKYKYLKGKEEVVTPLMIGHTLSTGPPEVAKESSGFTVPLGVFLILAAIFAVVFVLMIALNYWYKREDNKIMTRVNEARAAQTAEMLDTNLFRDETPESHPSTNGPVERNGAHHEPPSPGEKPPGDSTQAGSV